MDTTMDNFLTDQVQELELEKLRLSDGAGDHADGPTDAGDDVDCQLAGDQQTGRSDTGSVRSEKLLKDVLNQARTGGSEAQFGPRKQVRYHKCGNYCKMYKHTLIWHNAGITYWLTIGWLDDAKNCVHVANGDVT